VRDLSDSHRIIEQHWDEVFAEHLGFTKYLPQMDTD
jgi:hypothetical protein